MKSERLPAVRVSLALRNAAEEVLEEGETLSSLMLAAVMREIRIRKQEAHDSSRAEAQDKYLTVDAVLDELRRRLVVTRSQARKKQ